MRVFVKCLRTEYKVRVVIDLEVNAWVLTE